MFLFSTHAIAGIGTYSSSSTILKRRTKTGILPSLQSSFKPPIIFLLFIDQWFLLYSRVAQFQLIFLTNYWRKSTGPVSQDPFFARKTSQSIRRTNYPQISSVKPTNKPPRRESKIGWKSACFNKEESNNQRRGISIHRMQRGHFQASKSQILGQLSAKAQQTIVNPSIFNLAAYDKRGQNNIQITEWWVETGIDEVSLGELE